MVLAETCVPVVVAKFVTSRPKVKFLYLLATTATQRSFKGRSITHSGRQRSPAQRLTRKRPSWYNKLKLDSSEKTTWCQSACQALCSRAHCRHSRRWFTVRGILCKDTLARNPRCSRRRRIDEADISKLVAVDQRASNRLEEAVHHVEQVFIVTR
ncbi:uncharacterized protein TNCV_1696211 [Trichonephila clavipes]|nr:uncharacterized protein TNCV_1696211 [Trichonephila clavipes]